MNYNIKLNTKCFSQAEELENTLNRVSGCISLPDIEVSYKTIKDYITGAKNHPVVNFYEGE